MKNARRSSAVVYNPHLLGREDLLATFVARRPLLKELLDDLRRGGAQHHLLVGARGAGKTSMLLRLAYGIEDDRMLAKTCIPLRFPEEQYNVTQPSGFWINCIDALADALERRGDRDGVQKLDAAVASLAEVTEDERSRKSVAVLVGYAKHEKRRLVLLVDNLDLVLDRLHDAHWNLRDVLSKDNGIVLIGAGTTFAQAASYESPLYDFFNVHELGGLPEKEAQNLVIELARVAGTPEIERIVHDDPGRFRALFLLTGGMPRTLVLLHGLLGDGKSARVEDDLECLLDQVTPYYKAQFDDLATQSQVIVDAVALHWHPMTAAQCAGQTRMSVNSASAQLDRLVRQGVLTKVSGSGTHKLAFQLGERFFNIWYLMRASRRLRKRLGWLVEFLRVFYGDEDIRKRAEELLGTPAGRRAGAGGAAKLLAFASAITDAHLRRRLEFKAIEAIVERRRHPDDLRELLDLQGEDSHFAPVLDRAQVLRDLRVRIRDAGVRWPKGIAGSRWADQLTQSPFISTEEKVRIGDAVIQKATGHSGLIRRITADSLQDPLEDASFESAFYSAVGRGESPPLPELRTAEDLDYVVAAAKTPSRALARALMFSFMRAQRAMPAAVMLRALEIFPESGFIPTILVIDCVFRRDMGAALRCARIAIDYYRAQDDDREMFAAVFVVCQEFLEAGMAQELIGLLSETGINEKFLPLCEAARAAAAGGTAGVAHLAPEVRIPAETLLKLFRAGMESSSATELKARKMTDAGRDGGDGRHRR